MKVKILCPDCLKEGRKKLLGYCDDSTVGTVYLWCKSEKKEKKIVLMGGKENAK